MKAGLHILIAKTFKILTGKKIFTVGKFKTSRGNKCIECALKNLNRGQGLGFAVFGSVVDKKVLGTAAAKAYALAVVAAPIVHAQFQVQREVCAKSALGVAQKAALGASIRAALATGSSTSAPCSLANVTLATAAGWS